jgi:hypothetical protein
MPGAGHPFGYFSQERIEELGDEDTNCMVTGYDPAQEFVVVLLKPQDRASTYRLGVVARKPQEAVASEGTPNLTSEPAAEPELKPPDVETLIAWEAEGEWAPDGRPAPARRPGVAGGGRGHLRRMPPGGDDAGRRAGHRLPDADRAGQPTLSATIPW